ncbi:MAG: tRNA dihydrouridine synthase DusB [Leptospira sp.]|nr:tRNA dihydrouridine synthase DusB [Leptospira sp.]
MTKIGDVEIKGDVILAPMAGISDSPYRQICREAGSAFAYTEFVSTDGISHGSKKSIDLFRFSNAERPIFFQIFGNKLEVITEAAKIIEELGPDVIDMNMGCSVAKVAHKGSGAGMLRDPVNTGKIIESVRKAVNVPVTAKIRIGWDHQNLNYREMVHVLQESGIQAISVHGRTKSMAYTGLADWKIISEIKSFAKVPIFGNGDILSYKQAKERIAESGVDAVLIGRAAIGNPWIFSGIDKENVSFSEIKNMIVYHLNLMLEFYGSPFGLLLFRKHVSKYLKGYFGVSELRNKLVTSDNVDAFLGYLSEFNPDVTRSESQEFANEMLSCETYLN